MPSDCFAPRLRARGANTPICWLAPILLTVQTQAKKSALDKFTAGSVFVVFLLAFSSRTPLRAAESGVSPAPEVALLSTIKGCLRQNQQSARCLDLVFRQFLTQQTAAQALLLIQRYQEHDVELRLACHPVVHAIGRELFQQVGTIHNAFSACDQTCHSGCYHGVVERFLWGEASADGVPLHVSQALIQQKVAAACPSDAAPRLRFQCLHGLGHAVLYFNGDQLNAALELCDQLPDAWSRRSCYGGVFMENVTGASPEKRLVSAIDYHYPCNQVAPAYRRDCYLMQTSRMIEMGLPLEALFAECGRAESFRDECIQSIGRDLSNEARVYGPRQAASQCELASGTDRQACLRGVVYALVDNTWDGRYALPFCATLGDPSDVSYCFTVGTSYLNQMFEHNAAQVASECRRHLVEPSFCIVTMPH